MENLRHPVQIVDSFNLMPDLKDEQKKDKIKAVIAKSEYPETLQAHELNYQALKNAHNFYLAASVEENNDNFKNKLKAALVELKKITLQVTSPEVGGDGASAEEGNNVIFAFSDALNHEFGLKEGPHKEAMDKLAEFLAEDEEGKCQKVESLYTLLDTQMDEGKEGEYISSVKADELYLLSFAELEKLNDFIKNYPDNVENTSFDENDKIINRLLKQLCALLFTGCLPQKDVGSGNSEGYDLIRMLKENIALVIEQVDYDINNALDDFLHNDKFQNLEANWRALEYLVNNTDFSKDIKIDFLDVTQNELSADFAANRRDISNSCLFKKVYTQEYDQYGGQPYGVIIGLFEFENTKSDIEWLTTMGKIANAAHSPFISSVGAKFFVKTNDVNQLAEVKDLQGHMSQPMFDEWNAFRDTEEATYLGFTVPKFMIRQPYDRNLNPAHDLNYTESVKEHSDYLWGNAAMLFARNIIKSYESTSWSQTIRGPKNGGQIENLPRHSFQIDGLNIDKVPVEIVFPDYRELDFAKCGFIALVYQKDTSNACFFSSQSIKKSKVFKDPIDTENSQLVTNLSYTLSITKVAHYIKCIMRDNIGGSADTAFITKTIESWLSNYVTTVVNPDDLTLRSYPFKAISVETTECEGLVGWYSCIVKISPHKQFEGLDTELRLETRL